MNTHCRVKKRQKSRVDYRCVTGKLFPAQDDGGERIFRFIFHFGAFVGLIRRTAKV